MPVDSDAVSARRTSVLLSLHAQQEVANTWPRRRVTVFHPVLLLAETVQARVHLIIVFQSAPQIWALDRLSWIKGRGGGVRVWCSNLQARACTVANNSSRMSLCALAAAGRGDTVTNYGGP